MPQRESNPQLSRLQSSQTFKDYPTPPQRRAKNQNLMQTQEKNPVPLSSLAKTIVYVIPYKTGAVTCCRCASFTTPINGRYAARVYGISGTGSTTLVRKVLF